MESISRRAAMLVAVAGLGVSLAKAELVFSAPKGEKPMIKVTILYPKTPGSKFDFDYYLGTHMPMAIERLGASMRTISVDRATVPPEPWPAPTFWAICTFECASREVFEAAFFPHMEALQADIPNYTDVQQQLLVTEMALNHKGVGHHA